MKIMHNSPDMHKIFWIGLDIVAGMSGSYIIIMLIMAVGALSR